MFGFSSIMKSGPNRPTLLSPAALNDMLKAKSVFLADVREPNEYQSEHIVGAHLFPKSTLNPDAIFRAAGKDASICVQCLSGGRSAYVAKILENALNKTTEYGNIKLYDLDGGINAWKRASLPTSRTVS